MTVPDNALTALPTLDFRVKKAISEETDILSSDQPVSLADKLDYNLSRSALMLDRFFSNFLRAAAGGICSGPAIIRIDPLTEQNTAEANLQRLKILPIMVRAGFCVDPFFYIFRMGCRAIANIFFRGASFLLRLFTGNMNKKALAGYLKLFLIFIVRMLAVPFQIVISLFGGIVGLLPGLGKISSMIRRFAHKKIDMELDLQEHEILMKEIDPPIEMGSEFI